jgi:lysophospholipase L1-like esterase
MHRLRDIAINAALVMVSLAVGLLFCEFILFRFILLPSDVPANAFGNGIVRYAPHQTGVWRIRDEVAAPYAINAQGWNTGAGDYLMPRTPGVARIAVVGDSMIEAMQVAHDRSMAERLAQELSRDGRPVEVYRFAMSGAPLSQYLWMIEREVMAYRPDAIVINLAHNDFDESFGFVQGRYTSSFLKLRIAGGKVAEEIPPEPWRPRIADWVRRTATARYMYYRWQVRPGAIRELFLGSAHAETPRYEANIDVAAVLRQQPDILVATDYVLGRLVAAARPAGISLLLTMDGARGAIYAGKASEAVALNVLVAEVARRHDIAFVDLHAAFAADWAVNRKRFEFDSDSHWNEYGHAVVAHAAAAALRKKPP